MNLFGYFLNILAASAYDEESSNNRDQSQQQAPIIPPPPEYSPQSTSAFNGRMFVPGSFIELTDQSILLYKSKGSEMLKNGFLATLLPSSIVFYTDCSTFGKVCITTHHTYTIRITTCNRTFKIHFINDIHFAFKQDKLFLKDGCAYQTEDVLTTVNMHPTSCDINLTLWGQLETRLDIPCIFQNNDLGYINVKKFGSIVKEQLPVPFEGKMCLSAYECFSGSPFTPVLGGSKKVFGIIMPNDLED